jgi:ribosome-binding factor A
MNHRQERVQSLIQIELSKIIVREIEFPEGALATITGVEADKKLEWAKVLVSVIPSSAAAEAMRLLTKSAGELQYLLMKKINIKPMPRIRFELDRGPENAAVVEKLLIEDDNK